MNYQHVHVSPILLLEIETMNISPNICTLKGTTYDAYGEDLNVAFCGRFRLICKQPVVVNLFQHSFSYKTICYIETNIS